jgi:hypothetical protein
LKCGDPWGTGWVQIYGDGTEVLRSRIEEHPEIIQQLRAMRWRWEVVAGNRVWKVIILNQTCVASAGG